MWRNLLAWMLEHHPHLTDMFYNVHSRYHQDSLNHVRGGDLKLFNLHPAEIGANVMIIGPLQLPGGNTQRPIRPDDWVHAQLRRIMPTPVTPPLRVHEQAEHTSQAHHEEAAQEAIPSPNHPHGARHSIEHSPLQPQRPQLR